MKKILKITTALIFSLMISILSPNYVSAKTNTLSDNSIITYCNDNFAQSKEDLIKNFSKDNMTVCIEDKLINQTDTIIFRQSKQDYEITLDTADNNSYISSINDVCTIQYSASTENGSSTKNKTDESISVKITLKVDYKISDDMISITKVTSTLTACNGSTTSNVGSGVFIDSNQLTYGQTGFYHGGYKTQNDTKTLPNKACTKSYTPNGWIAVANSTGSTVGANQTVGLHRGNSKWSVTLVNNIVG